VARVCYLSWNNWIKNIVGIRLIDLLAKKHNDWIRVARSLGANDHIAKDIVQNMYLKIHDWAERNQKSILYTDKEVNYYFVFKVLNTLYMDYLRKNKKYIPTINTRTFEKSNEDALQQIEFTEDLKSKLTNLHWYDQRIFNIVVIQGMSMLQLSELTGISYYSIKRTIKKVKKHLK
tara:strand:+ start:4106 stop:4633 length:528 start_codon:yes stop_codon:yes gene_type:complete